jgi:hypothetical protein
MSVLSKKDGQHCRNDITAAGNKTHQLRSNDFKKEVVRIIRMSTKNKIIRGWSTSPE